MYTKTAAGAQKVDPVIVSLASYSREKQRSKLGGRLMLAPVNDATKVSMLSETKY